MEAHKSVIVLTPNGRRQNVKVTPNTTLLQVLEQACSKHGFHPHEYDLRHHNKIMDVENVIRFTGLPNNALLEMVPALKTRKDSEVVLGVQIESGDRFTGSFMPSDNLWSVLNKLCPEEISKEGNPVVIYMRTEVSGNLSLESTTLRTLGITGGRAMLRFVHRSPETLRTQANVSAPLPRPVSKHKIDSPEEGRSYDSIPLDKLSNESKENSDKEKVTSNIKGRHELTKALAVPSTTEAKQVEIQESEVMNEEVIQPVEEEEKRDIASNILQGTEWKQGASELEEEEPMDTTDSKKEAEGIAPLGVSEDSHVEEEIKLLPGDRSGCVFNMNQPTRSSAECTEHDLPDEFFQVTVEDARIWLRDLKKRRAELEDAPLQTSAAREANEVHFLVMPCVIRIMFPDRIVLQGCFVGGETVDDIKSFVRENIEDPSHPFHLYLAPPKVVLKSTCLLYKVDGFPAVRLYFAYDKDDSSDVRSEVPRKQYIRSDVLVNLISQTAATKVAQKARGIPFQRQNSAMPNKSCTDDTAESSPKPMTSRRATERDCSTRNSGSRQTPVSQVSTEKVPKWFHSAKK